MARFVQTDEGEAEEGKDYHPRYDIIQKIYHVASHPWPRAYACRLQGARVALLWWPYRSHWRAQAEGPWHHEALGASACAVHLPFVELKANKGFLCRLAQEAIKQALVGGGGRSAVGLDFICGSKGDGHPVRAASNQSSSDIPVTDPVIDSLVLGKCQFDGFPRLVKVGLVGIDGLDDLLQAHPAGIAERRALVPVLIVGVAVVLV